MSVRQFGLSELRFGSSAAGEDRRVTTGALDSLSAFRFDWTSGMMSWLHGHRLLANACAVVDARSHDTAFFAFGPFGGGFTLRQGCDNGGGIGQQRFLPLSDSSVAFFVERVDDYFPYGDDDLWVNPVAAHVAARLELTPEGDWVTAEAATVNLGDTTLLENVGAVPDGAGGWWVFARSGTSDAWPAYRLAADEALPDTAHARHRAGPPGHFHEDFSTRAAIRPDGGALAVSGGDDGLLLYRLDRRSGALAPWVRFTPADLGVPYEFGQTVTDCE